MTIKILDYVIYWAILLIPFSMAIAPAPMNVFMGLAIAAYLLKKICKKERPFVSTGLNVPLFALFVVTCLSLLNSVDLRDSLRGGVFRLLQYILIFFVVCEELKDKKQLKWILISVLAGLFLSSSDGIFQVITGHGFIRRDYAPVLNIGLVRAISSFKDSNTYGIYLSAIAPLVFAFALYYTKGIIRALFWLASLLGIAAICLTYSRPTLLALYIVLWILSLVKKDKVLVGILVAFTVISPFLLPKTVKEWAREVDYNPARFMCNDDRIAVYKNSLNMIKAHPVIGVGAGVFMKSYKGYKDPVEYRNVVTLDEMKAHNNFLHMAGEIGLLGLAIFLWLLYRLFKESLNIYRKLKDHFIKLFSLSLIVCLISFLVNGLTESSLYYSRVSLIFWYLAGLSLALKKFSHADRSRQD